MIIGDVDTRFDHLKRGDWDLYMAFYNGWLEGRTQLITDLKRYIRSDPEFIEAVRKGMKKDIQEQ